MIYYLIQAFSNLFYVMENVFLSNHIDQYYWNCKNFHNDGFRSEIQSFCSLSKSDLRLFRESIFFIFNKHVPIRKKYRRANKAPFMTKKLHNSIMNRPRCKKKFLKDKSQTSKENYKIQ